MSSVVERDAGAAVMMAALESKKIEALIINLAGRRRTKQKGANEVSAWRLLGGEPMHACTRINWPVLGGLQPCKENTTNRVTGVPVRYTGK
jgi:hypothetical protein